MLFERNKKELDVRRLTELDEINPCLQPSQMTIDFEAACLLAFEELFPKVSVIDEYFSLPLLNRNMFDF